MRPVEAEELLQLLLDGEGDGPANQIPMDLHAINKKYILQYQVNWNYVCLLIQNKTLQ